MRSVGVVLFDGFELLDVFGPVTLFSRLTDQYRVRFASLLAGPVRSSQGVDVIAGHALTGPSPDIVLVSGGIGTRALVHERDFLDSLRSWAAHASIVSSVCTGSALLAAAGLLDGYRATSNKRAFDWAAQHGDRVEWVRKARWVHDRDRWTSSGVAAGMDMAAALISDLSGTEAARRAAWEIELDVHTDAAWDPFSEP